MGSLRIFLVRKRSISLPCRKDWECTFATRGVRGMACSRAHALLVWCLEFLGSVSTLTVRPHDLSASIRWKLKHGLLLGPPRLPTW